MSSHDETRLKRLSFRAWRRGFREADLILGPFVGAVVGEMISHGKVEQATRAGVATWLGLIFGTLAKLALVFTMLGVFALAYFV